MERSHLDFEGFFDVVQETDDAQAAQMTLRSGQSTGGPNNYHADSDQWLFVVNGTGMATVDGDEYRWMRATWSLLRPTNVTKSRTMAMILWRR